MSNSDSSTIVGGNFSSSSSLAFPGNKRGSSFCTSKSAAISFQHLRIPGLFSFSSLVSCSFSSSTLYPSKSPVRQEQALELAKAHVQAWQLAKAQLDKLEKMLKKARTPAGPPHRQTCAAASRGPPCRAAPARRRRRRGRARRRWTHRRGGRRRRATASRSAPRLWVESDESAL